VKNGNHDHNFHRYWSESLVCLKNIEISDLYTVQEIQIIFFKFNRLNIDWQKKCLDLPARRKNQNLIYTLPTSGGKVEILMIQDTSNALFFVDISC
jgi:hypothetical protein